MENVLKANTITLVVPVFNEEKAIPLFVEQLETSLFEINLKNSRKFKFQILFVNDGSTDASEFIIRNAKMTNAEIQLVSLSRNFGKERALFAGLTYALGDAVIPMDVDLQDPPEVIEQMLNKWSDGASIVNAKRISRSEDSWMKRTTATAFYRIFNFFAERPIPENVGDFRLLDRQVVDAVVQVGDKMRFNKEVFSWVGFTSEQVEFERPKRSDGTGKWSVWKLWNLALDGIFSSSTMPLRLWGYLGFLFSLLAFVYVIFVIVFTVVFGRSVPGYSSTIVMILFFGGLNLLSLGVLGEYIGRIFTEVRERPTFIVKSTFGLEEE
ncbi:hypothetical protein BFP76_00775 [Amylibacter kogurei]|uniref:Glycosyltransferase 2-like domain-containing protein n=1 Tax=Paramylibacter kogurei TaxID=1889778 RepID=A0A2G5K849_9RHOB|nr:hypothetical protein BFP76_00775 [Amylibacter kogurei]